MSNVKVLLPFLYVEILYIYKILVLPHYGNISFDMYVECKQLNVTLFGSYQQFCHYWHLSSSSTPLKMNKIKHKELKKTGCLYI